MTPVEIIALVLIVLAALKIVLLPCGVWLRVVKKLYSAPKVLFLVELVLAALVFYYLLQVFSVVQILAVVAFGGLLTALSFAIYSKETLAWAGKVLKKDVLRKAWLPILIWLALIVWGALELFNAL